MGFDRLVSVPLGVSDSVGGCVYCAGVVVSQGGWIYFWVYIESVQMHEKDQITDLSATAA